MTIPRLIVIPAGAGSGKTHRIQTQLADWVVSGEVAPERILAVTFTEAAASELKERIRFELVRRDRIEAALRLEESYISTIHGFGLRLLTEFAFEGGGSPSPRLLNDDEQKFLVRRTLSKTDKAEPVAMNLRKYGYLYDPVTAMGPEDVFLRMLLGLIDRLRSLGRKGEDANLINGAIEMIRRRYGPTQKADVLNRTLHMAVTRLLNRFPRDLSSGFQGNASAEKDFRDNFRALRRAEDIEEIASDWDLWASLGELRIKAKGGTVPAGYVELAEDVMTSAKSLSRHPGPLKDAEIHLGAVLGASQDCLAKYGEEKRKACLVDYPDMPAGAHEILANRPDVLDTLKGRIDCVVIDEFQDTNPLQFALLWKIHEAGVPALVVGDVKQSIMGFQNADPRLLKELEAKHSKSCEPLTGNWRCSAPLMQWVNAVGEGLFGTAYTSLTPKADFPSALAPVEVVEAAKFPKSNRARASWTALRIKSLLDDKNSKVWDKTAKDVRRIRGGDVAVLCPTNDMVEAYAEVLQVLGIRTRIEQGGWFESPVVQIACHALSYVADRDDRHATLFLAVTELGSHTLESALKILLRNEELKDPVLDFLEPLRQGAHEKTVETLMAEVIKALDLYGKVAWWPDGAQARANLLRLQAEVREFQEANRQVLLAGGYYGGGLKTFLAWLAAKVEDNDAQPQPRVVDEDAVAVTTWHSAKGLEWPVVAICGMHRELKPRLPDVAVNYEDFADLAKILEKARIEITPAFAADETNQAFLEPLQREQEEEARRLLYVAMTRAREKVILEWPSYLAGKDRTTNWSLFTRAAVVELDKMAMRVKEKSFPCVLNAAGTVVAPEVEGSTGEPVASLASFGRRALEYRSLPTELTPESIVPSRLRGEPFEAVVSGLQEESYAPPLDVEVGAGGADRGLMLHSCFEVLGGRAHKTDLIARATGVHFEEEVLCRIAEAVAAFDRWLEGRFQPLSVRREWPLLGLDDHGSVVSGVVDVLVETEKGFWILDHKSDVTDDRSARFDVYRPQLASYADLVRKVFPGKPVLGVGTHWISYGTVTVVGGGETE